MERIKTRNRKGEENISFQYMNELDILHRTWLSSVNHSIINNELD